MGTPSNLGNLDRVGATLPSQAPAGAAYEAPDLGQWEGQDVPWLDLVPALSKEASQPTEDTYLHTFSLRVVANLVPGIELGWGVESWCGHLFFIESRRQLRSCVGLGRRV